MVRVPYRRVRVLSPRVYYTFYNAIKQISKLVFIACAQMVRERKRGAGDTACMVAPDDIRDIALQHLDGGSATDCGGSKL